MPAYYRIEGLTRVDDKYLDKPIMSAQDVEDILSFLMKLQ
jgi:sulfur-oxidizing protein SoxX